MDADKEKAEELRDEEDDDFLASDKFCRSEHSPKPTSGIFLESHGVTSEDEGVPECEDVQEGQGRGQDQGVPGGVPVDHGWAWIICGACFQITFIMAMYDHVLAVMFVDIKERFDVSYTTASSVFTIYSVTFSVGSVVSTNAIAPRLGDRVVVVSAAIINSITTLILAFSTHVALFHALHLIKGFCIGSMWIPALGLIGQYFHQRRSLATVLTNSGVAVSLLAVPRLVRELLDNYGFQGTLLLISAMEMHSIAAGMLLRPVSLYRRGVSQEKIIEVHDDSSAYDALVPIKDTLVNNEEVDDLWKQRKDCNSVFRTCNDNDAATRPMLKTVPNGQPSPEDIQRKNPLIGQIIDQMQAPTNQRTSFDDLQRKNSQIGQINGMKQASAKEQQLLSDLQKKNSLIGQINSVVQDSNNRNNVDSETTYTINSSHRSLMDAEEIDSKENHQLPQHTCNGYLRVNNKHKTHQDDKDPIANAKHVEIEVCMDLSDKSDSWPRKSLCERCLDVIRSYFDTELLSDWLMRLMLASTALGALLQYIPSYIPTLAVERGVDKPSAAMLLTVSGGVNLVSLLLQGFIVDCKILTASVFISVAQCIVGTMCHLIHFFTSFPTLLLLSVTWGMFGGARMSLIPVVAMDFVGVANLGKSLGFNAMVATVSLSAHHPFLGYLLEETGSFAVPFHYVGLALYLSAALLLLEPVARKLNSRKTVRH